MDIQQQETKGKCLTVRGSCLLTTDVFLLFLKESLQDV